MLSCIVPPNNLEGGNMIKALLSHALVSLSVVVMFPEIVPELESATWMSVLCHA